MGPKTVASCLDILNNKGSIKESNDTNIVLIPKCGNPCRVTDFRPISLCNVSYKIVTKVLANRLKRVLNEVISVSQSTFVPGRFITDNIIIGHKSLHVMKEIKIGREGYVTLKLDMSKAYDQVEWIFVEKVMLKLGFCTDWVDLIMRCISSVSFALNINGVATGKIVPSRGLRQGDLISPYLFLLCAEGLSALIKDASDGSNISRLSLTNPRLVISHLFFADDSLIFLRADAAECCEFKRIFQLYERSSGHVVNFDKSMACFSPNIVSDRKIYLQSLLGVRLVDNLGPYLGLP